MEPFDGKMMKMMFFCHKFINFTGGSSWHYYYADKDSTSQMTKPR